ncbi:MAG: hypothetical protein IPJ01_10660 [Micavibrio sp.]|nr:hypothetical protein [Micavibrio sp.]
MLAEEKIQDPNAVEEHFCKEFEKINDRYSMMLRTMDDFETEMFLMLLNSKPVTLDKIAIKDKQFLYDIIEKRIKYVYTFKVVDSRVILFLCSVTKTIGIAVMYLTYLQYICKKENIRELSFDKLTMDIFPDGFPRDEALKEVWLKQKVKRDSGSDNLVDYQSAMKSIQFID